MIKAAVGKIVANCMARSTIGSRVRMRISRLRFSNGSGCKITGTTIMAGGTITGNAYVSEIRCRLERSSGDVAYVTILGRRQMVCCLNYIGSGGGQG